MDDSTKMYNELDYHHDMDDSDLMLDIGYSLTLPEIPTSFIPSPGSETMDIACKPNLHSEFPYSPRGPPERNSYQGDFNFCVEVNSNDVHKKTFLYSHRLCRIYVDMKYNFSVQFNWDYVKAPHMFVRSTVVFSDETQAEKRVERCVQHFHESSVAGIQKEIAKNVLHSSREIGTQGVFYCGNVEMADSWYSVLVEFMRTSCEPCTHAYQFSCKNSCATGINRRAIAIIFTLENEFGRVYGRQRVGARVCACPRRDMLKDETADGVYKTGQKRILANQIEPIIKKIKIENLTDYDESIIKLPPIEVIGLKAMVAGLRTMQAMMELAADHRNNDPEAEALYEKQIAIFKETIQKYENTKTP